MTLSRTAYDLSSNGRVVAARRRPAIKRSYRTVIIALMVATSSIALYDLFLFAISGFH